MEIVRLKKENYDELIGLLNLVFTAKNKKEMDFEKDLPKMCVRDDEHMGRHFGVFEDGRLVAALGVYLLPVTVAGEKLLFSTVGNIATHPDYQGKGYMNALIERAMQELADIGADASRLGGLRHRYNRFGYENCGRMYQASFNEHNRKCKFNGVGEDVVIEKIE
ncbi:MAG: GNAT family N-acetyltransferase, partial [Clostridia bacterium]|nr:GNAT family N-acetyltransferase [Clostridia bacterium]